jgi:hypothetical protein
MPEGLPLSRRSRCHRLVLAMKRELVLILSWRTSWPGQRQVLPGPIFKAAV